MYFPDKIGYYSKGSISTPRTQNLSPLLFGSAQSVSHSSTIGLADHFTRTSALRASIPCIMKDIENELKKLDESFEFPLEDELNLIHAAKCVKDAAIKLVLEKRNLESKLLNIESLNSKASKLASLETRMKIRERALIENENTLKLENARIEALAIKHKEEQARLQQEKMNVEESFRLLNEENIKISMQMKHLDEKYSDVMHSLKNLQERSNSNCLVSINSPDKGLKPGFKTSTKEKKNLEADIPEKQLKINELIKENQDLLKALESVKKELSRQRKEASKVLESELIKLKAKKKHCEEKQKELESALALLSKEFTYINTLKKSLQEYQTQVLSEQQRFKRQYALQIQHLLESHNQLASRLQILSSKEESFENSIKALYLREEAINTKEQTFKKFEIHKEHYELAIMKLQDLQSELHEREIRIEFTESALLLKQNALTALESKDKNTLVAIISEINLKLESLQHEEIEMQKMQNFAARVKEENELNSELLNSIHKELIRQQESLTAEHEKLKIDKASIANIQSKLESESLNLSAKEEDLLKSLQNLIARESNLPAFP